MTEQEFIEKIAPLARKDMKESGILASITIAQACLESAYGSSELAEKANNLFGMKCMLSGNTWESIWDGQEYRKKPRSRMGRERHIILPQDFGNIRILQIA